MKLRILCRTGCMSLIAAMFCLPSCINIDNNLGRNYLENGQKYDIHSEQFDVDDIELLSPDSLSAYSTYKFTFGAVRDEVYGLSERSCAFTLVPMNDTLDFGKVGTRKFKSFKFYAVPDTISCSEPSQADILQNINVYELQKGINFKAAYPKVKIGKTRITDGIPVYNGKGALVFDFSKEFGEKYMSIRQSDLDTISNYTKRFPGIYISSDDPIGNGGRINMFRLPIDKFDNKLNGSYALLSFSAEYEKRGIVDTSFVFYFGPVQFYRKIAKSELTDAMKQVQVALNMDSHDNVPFDKKAGENIYFEGGRGVKPVIKANKLKKAVIKELSKYGDPQKNCKK